MKQLVIVFLIIAMPYIGLAQQTINGSISHDGIQRDYILYVPVNYTGNLSVPLIINFHGYGSNANEQILPVFF
jgi:polyhydroxybutyrate depolymerase